MVKKIMCILICAVLAAALSLQGFALEWIREDLERAREDTSISPEIDELLDLYIKYSLYELDREQAILLMLRSFLASYDAAPLLADSLLTAFDRFGGYYTQTSIGEMFSGAFRGYGVLLGGRNMIDGHLYNIIIRKVFPDSPAESAGFEPGDEFLVINGINVEGMGLPAVSNLLASVENEAEIIVRRGERRVNISVEKGRVFTNSLTFETPLEKTALITLDDFTDPFVAYDFYWAMRDLEEAEYENLIIDLRGNGGGSLDSMTVMLDMLVADEGVVLYSVMERDGKLQSLFSTGGGFEFEQIIILVNGRTASASEIFAKSLREITGAVIIGSQTAGKGIGQYYEELENGNVAAFTAFEIFSSAGSAYHARGVAPDIEARPVFNNIERGSLEQLNFVNSANIRQGAENQAVLALNQRLARIGYIQPGDITGEATERTAAAVEIFQRFHDLAVGIDRIDFRFIEILNQRVSLAPGSYEYGDAVLERAIDYISGNYDNQEE
jgi:carboxyl-terminal processing protease